MMIPGDGRVAEDASAWTPAAQERHQGRAQGAPQATGSMNLEWQECQGVQQDDLGPCRLVPEEFQGLCTVHRSGLSQLPIVWRSLHGHWLEDVRGHGSWMPYWKGVQVHPTGLREFTQDSVGHASGDEQCSA